MPTQEFNLDTLVGPTHNYAGLAHGNIASQRNARLLSRPKAAALQGLDKMKFLADRGIPQLVLPPQPRPHLPALRALGFTGNDADLLAAAAQSAPHLLAACCSSSSMWTANAATVSPSPDTADHRLHITPANLASHLHRALETPFTAALLKHIFPGPLFLHHDPLPAAPETADEGAANHSRFCADHHSPGVELFTYGHDSTQTQTRPPRFRPRHTRAASEAVARLHQLAPNATLFAQQNPAAIDAGAFHADVLSVAHRHIFFYHERAFLNSPTLIENLSRALGETGRGRGGGGGADLLPVMIPDQLLPLADAVRCYLFNSQLVTLPDNTIVMLAPIECSTHPPAQAAIDFLRATANLRDVYFVDVRQSMRNGGGPACLRLRAVLTDDQQSAVPPHVRLTPALYKTLRIWIEKKHRDQLLPQDLADPALLKESQAALAELATILHLPSEPVVTVLKIKPPAG